MCPTLINLTYALTSYNLNLCFHCVFQLANLLSFSLSVDQDFILENSLAAKRTNTSLKPSLSVQDFVSQVSKPGFPLQILSHSFGDKIQNEKPGFEATPIHTWHIMFMCWVAIQHARCVIVLIAAEKPKRGLDTNLPRKCLGIVHLTLSSLG